MNYLEPKSITIACADGDTREFIIHKFPAIAGREILSQYPLTAAPKIGNYQENEKLMLKLMCYVHALDGDKTVPLNSQLLVDKHIPEFETLMKLEWEVMQYNCSFFQNGGLSALLAEAVALFIKSTSLTSMDSSDSSSPTGAPH